MTGRPRVWTLWGGPEDHPLFENREVEPGEFVRAVEWHEDRTVAAIRSVLLPLGAAEAQEWAEVIFHALGHPTSPEPL